MAWDKDTALKFERITGYDYAGLMRRFIDFNSNQKPKIFDYYSGSTDTPDGTAFKQLDQLREDFKSAISLVSLNKEAFSEFNDWDLFKDIEEISGKLDTIDKSSKYFRSARLSGRIASSPSIETTLGNQQTLENLSNSLSFEDPQNDWTKLFLENNLTEESYTADGGALLSVNLSGSASNSLNLTSVVDNINTAEKTYGIDIQKELEFEGDDLKVLTYQETLQQSIDILSNLSKGDNPEFPTQGVDKSIVIGSTIGAIAFPSIFRQIAQNFESDDTFVSFAISDVAKENDALKFEYQVRTRTNELVTGSIFV